jgi:glutathione S-transferase
VTLYRDHHAWCPYCQKVWLFLEEKRIPYRVDKVTMRCYGPKEAWFTKMVPSGMLPAIEIDGQLVTESDEILLVLEEVFGQIEVSLEGVLELRQLERQLFAAWCTWIRVGGGTDDVKAQRGFEGVLARVAAALESTPGCYFLSAFSVADIIFAPFLERMLASLYFYKGFDMKAAQPTIANWFAAMESRETYRGTQSDFTTHVDDLPPQMGGLFANLTPAQMRCEDLVRRHQYQELPECGVPEADRATSVAEAAARVLRHHQSIVEANPHGDKAALDEALRATVANLVGEGPVAPPAGTDAALRYLRNRISVPRDMSIWAARRLRDALEETAAMVGTAQPQKIDVRQRYDQDPRPFGSVRGSRWGGKHGHGDHKFPPNPAMLSG